MTRPTRQLLLDMSTTRGTEFLHSTTVTVAWLKQVHDAGTLIMSPPFQRNPVWTEAQKSYLIDTILHGYPIPELYMQQEVDATGNEKHILVDGQQRVRACLEFIEGKFTINGKDSPQWGDMEFEDFSAADRKRVFAYKFVVRTLPLVDDATLRGIFQRLNRNTVALTAQELRHATYWGPFIVTMEKISDFEFWDGTGLFTANDVRRMGDVEFISELTMAFLHGPQNKKANLEKTYQVYETQFDDAERVEQMFVRVGGEINQVLPDIRQTRWRKKSDFYTLFLVFAAHLSALPLSAERRTKARESLLRFGKEVDDAVTLQPSQRRRVKASVKKYATAVERAASDLNNRKARSEALETLLGSVLVD